MEGDCLCGKHQWRLQFNMCTDLMLYSALKEPADLFQDLASIEIVAMLNEAFCKLHHKPYCPASEELSRECGKVRPNTLAGNSFCLWVFFQNHALVRHAVRFVEQHNCCGC